jgi:hypothetical protein
MRVRMTPRSARFNTPWRPRRLSITLPASRSFNARRSSVYGGLTDGALSRSERFWFDLGGRTASFISTSGLKSEERRHGRLAQLVRAPALQATRPFPKLLWVLPHFQGFQQLGESACRSKTTQAGPTRKVLSRFCHGPRTTLRLRSVSDHSGVKPPCG